MIVFLLVKEQKEFSLGFLLFCVESIYCNVIFHSFFNTDIWSRTIMFIFQKNFAVNVSWMVYTWTVCRVLLMSYHSIAFVMRSLWDQTLCISSCAYVNVHKFIFRCTRKVESTNANDEEYNLCIFFADDVFFRITWDMTMISIKNLVSNLTSYTEKLFLLHTSLWQTEVLH